jgi:hypothetical protein
MPSASHPIMADPRLYLSDVHALAGFLGGLSGAALIAVVAGALIGYAAACKIDALPAGIGIALGVIGMFFVLNIPV